MNISSLLIKKNLKDCFEMSYKLIKSRPVDYDKENLLLTKGLLLFSVKVSKIIKSFDLFMNIGETLFSRSTKAPKSWSIK